MQHFLGDLGLNGDFSKFTCSGQVTRIIYPATPIVAERDKQTVDLPSLQSVR